jgi:SpoIID/LytB domain protein
MSQYGARGMALEGSTGTQIVQHYFTGTTVSPIADMADIRVNLLHQKSAVVVRTEALAAGGGGIDVMVGGKDTTGGPADTFTFTVAAGVVSVRRTTNGVTTTIGSGSSALVRWAGTRTPGSAGAGATVLDVATTTAGLAGAGHRYRYGTLDIASAAGTPSTLEAVNSLRIHDEYLFGIGEMSSSWPAAALQAQVLASRSYALSRFGAGGVRAACRCQVDSGQGPYYDQTFRGWVKESGPSGSAWRAAVTSTFAGPTTGLAVLYNGAAIPAYYFSSSGGATQSSQDVWVATLPYAQSVDDHWSMDPSVPSSSWAPQVRTQAQVAAAFGLADVVRIDLSSRTVAGGVKLATAWSSTGATASIRGETMRSKLGFPSTWVWRAVESTTGVPITTAARSASYSTSPDVVIAPSESRALIAVAQNLGSQKGWPVLLVQRTGVPTATRAELLRRKASRLHVIGTSSQIPAAVMTALSPLGRTVSRYAGASVPDLSVAVAGALGLRKGTPAVVSAASDAFGSELASATACATRRALLILPGGAHASASVSSYLSATAPTRTTVVGSTTQIPDSVIARWRGTARVSGTNPVDYASRVLATLGPVRPLRVVLTTYANSTNALLAAPGAPLVVVTTTLPAAAKALLQRGVTTISVTAGVSAAVVQDARRA